MFDMADRDIVDVFFQLLLIDWIYTMGPYFLLQITIHISIVKFKSFKIARAI